MSEKRRWKETLVSPDRFNIPAGEELAWAAWFVVDAMRYSDRPSHDEWNRRRLQYAGWLIREERKRLDPEKEASRWEPIYTEDDARPWAVLQCLAAASSTQHPPSYAGLALRIAEAHLREHWKATAGRSDGYSLLDGGER